MNRTLSLRVAFSISASTATVVAATLFSASAAQAQGTRTATLPLSTALIAFQDKSAAQYYNDGVNAFNAGKFDEGITAFTNAIKKRSGAPYADAYYGRGLCYNRKKEYAKAVDDFKQTIAVKPNLPDAYLEMASAYTGMDKYQEALAAYTTAEQKGASKNDILRFRGGLYYRMKDYDKAIADWSAYLAADPKAPASIHYNIGLAYLDKKNYPNAVTSFTNALKGQPNYGPALSARAEAYLGMDPKKYAEAAADAEAALKIDPKDDSAVRSAAEAYAGTKQLDKLTALAKQYPDNTALLGIAATKKLEAGDFPGAISGFTAFLAKEPNNVAAQQNLAQAYVGAKQWDNAIRVYDGVLKADPKNAVAFHNRGVAYFYKDAPDKAIADFDQAIKLDPKYYDAYVNKSLAAMKKATAGDKAGYQLAIDAATAALAIKDNPDVRYRRGAAYYNIEQYEKALPDLEAYQKVKPNDPDVAGLIADCYIKTGKNDVAESKLLEAIKVKPNDAQNYADLGRLRIQGGKFADAISPLSKAIELKPADTASKFNRGLAYFKTSKWQEAVTDMTGVLATDPKNGAALALRADANFNLKQYKAAIQDYTAFLATNPAQKERDDALKGLLDAANASKDPKLAVDVFTQILAKDPANPTALKSRGIAYLNDKQYANAQKDLEAFTAKTPNDADVWFNLGLVYKQTNEADKEAAAYEKSASLKADFSAGSNAGIAYTKMGEKIIDSDPKKASEYFDKAIANFDIAIKTNPKPDQAAIAYFNKAVAYEKKAEATQDDSHLKGAVAAYTKYLELNPMATDKKAVQDTIAELKGKLGIK